MPTVPRDPAFDSTFAFLAEGYRFISDRCERFGTDIFETRLMLRPVFCVRGAEAAEMFYHPDHFTRNGAIPPTTVMLLQDFGSIATLDDPARHQRRKQMFLSLASPASVARLAQRFAYQWGARLARWERQGSIVLHDEVERILARAVCDWAGIPISGSDADARASESSAMIEGAGAFGPRLWKGLWLRPRTERWARDVIAAARRGDLPAPQDSALAAIAWYRDVNGKYLDTNTAAIELVNLLRPTVAVARWITFAAHALHLHPHYRALLQENDRFVEPFVQEVRRFYPFFPSVAGLVKNEFSWRGLRFNKGTWVLLDIYGTNHHPLLWDEPDVFNPHRYGRQPITPFNFIPQGAGDSSQTHRCPGEAIAVELTSMAVRLLTSFMEYDVPPQDLSLSLARIPALPKSRLVLENVRLAAAREPAARTPRRVDVK